MFLGNDFTTHKNYSDQVAREIDEEVKRIIEEAYAEAERLLKDNMDILTRVAEALLLVETIDGEQFEDLFTGKVTAEELAEKVRIDSEVRKARDDEEAAENERLRREEDERLKAELEKYDTDYMDEDIAEEEEAHEEKPAEEEAHEEVNKDESDS